LPSFFGNYFPDLKVIFYLFRNFLEVKSFEIRGQEETRVKQFGKLAIFSCILLCISTGTISDGGDMNWTLHTIGATGFFLIALYIVKVASAVYRDLYVIKPFVAEWSYQIKKYTNFFLLSFIVI